MSEQQTDQGFPGALEPGVASLLQAFDAQGNHRTGTAVDNASADWLTDQVRQLGLEPSLETFTLSRADPQLAYARLANRRIDGVPMADSGCSAAMPTSAWPRLHRSTSRTRLRLTSFQRRARVATRR